MLGRVALRLFDNRHLERRQYRADVLHVSREQYEREQQTYQPPALKIERDSNRFYLVPTEVQENGERIMAMQIQEVTIRATTRTLPERLGKVTIDFVIDMPRQLQGTCRSIAVIPYLHKYGEAHPLQDITIRGGLFSRVQDRDYWQYNKYLHVFNPSEIGAERASARFVKISLQRRLTTGQHRSTSGAYLILLFAGSTYG